MRQSSILHISKGRFEKSEVEVEVTNRAFSRSQQSFISSELPVSCLALWPSTILLPFPFLSSFLLFLSFQPIRRESKSTLVLLRDLRFRFPMSKPLHQHLNCSSFTNKNSRHMLIETLMRNEREQEQAVKLLNEMMIEEHWKEKCIGYLIGKKFGRKIRPLDAWFFFHTRR